MYYKIHLFVLSYIIERSVFLPVAIAGLQLTVAENQEKNINLSCRYYKKNISKIKRAFSGNILYPKSFSLLSY